MSLHDREHRGRQWLDRVRRVPQIFRGAASVPGWPVGKGVAFGYHKWRRIGGLICLEPKYINGQVFGTYGANCDGLRFVYFLGCCACLIDTLSHQDFTPPSSTSPTIRK